MTRVATHGILLLFLCGSLFFIESTSQWFGVAAGAGVAIAISLLDIGVANRRYMKLAFYACRHPKSRIRLSVSYLYRIKLDQEYLLVRGRRFPQFQPVGGVYKVAPDSKAVLSKLKAQDDQLVPIDSSSRRDLRIRVPSSHLIAFMRWFESERDREVGPWREFYEELVSPGILSSTDFGYVDTRFIAREIRPLRFSNYANSLELLIADVFELALNGEQEAALRDLRSAGHPDIMWATEDLIRRRGAAPGQNQSEQVAEPAEWVLDA